MAIAEPAAEAPQPAAPPTPVALHTAALDARAPAPRPAADGTTAPEATRERSSAPEVRSPRAATALALGVTGLGAAAIVVPWIAGGQTSVGGMAAGGVLAAIGPSVGHFYAGETGRALGMSLGRVAAIGAGTVGAMVVAFNSDCDVFRSDSTRKDCSFSATYVLVGAGLSIATGLAIVDLWDAGSAAERFNERHRAPPQQAWMVAPVVAERQLGLVLAAPF